MVALSDSFLISKGGCDDDDMSFGTVAEAGSMADGDMMLLGFGRFASGEFGRDGGACSVCAACLGGGVEALVITWNSRRDVNIAVGNLCSASLTFEKWIGRRSDIRYSEKDALS